MRKKLCAFISVSIMVLMLAACGATDNSSSPSGDVANGKNEVSSSTDANTDTNVGANTNTTPEQEQVEVDPGIEQMVGEYIAGQNKTPKYYLINPIYQCLDELADWNKQQLLENRVAIVYFGEERLPSPNDKVLIVPTFFDETVDQKTLEEVIETINGYYIGEITNTPYNLEEVSSKYSDAKPPKVLTSLMVRKTLKDCIDISNYYGVLTGVENTKDYTRSISHALPFVVYDIDSEGNIYNASVKDETWVLHANVLLGKANSVMIVKMNEVETYDILLRVSEEGLNDCNFYDVPGYKVLTTNLTEKEVGKIVLPGGVLNPEYDYLMNNKRVSDEEAVGKTLFEYLIRTGNNPRYFINDYYYKKFDELNGTNRISLSEDPTVYVYFGNSETPRKNEKLFVVDARFEKALVEIPYLEDIIDSIKNSKVVAVEIADNLGFIND